METEISTLMSHFLIDFFWLQIKYILLGMQFMPLYKHAKWLDYNKTLFCLYHLLTSLKSFKNHG